MLKKESIKSLYEMAIKNMVEEKIKGKNIFDAESFFYGIIEGYRFVLEYTDDQTDNDIKKREAIEMENKSIQYD